MKIKFWEKEQRTSIENPSTPINSQNIVGNMVQLLGFGGAKTKSGKTVTPDTAWNYSAVYAAIRLLSETVAQLPLDLHKLEDGERHPATEHPLYGLIHDNPSDRLTSFVWRETQMGHCLSWGNGYAYIERTVRENRPTGLRLLRPDKTTAKQDGNGSYFYITRVDGKEYRIDPRDMLHIPALGSDGLCGLSPITMHRETLGLSMRATEFGAEFFGNGASLGGIIKHPTELGMEARANLKASWERLKGSGYQGVAVLDEGMDYTRIAIPPNDAQFLETRKFQITEVARIFNIPPHMLRDLEKSAFNNMTEQSIEFLRFTMTPWLVKWEQELNRKLLTDNERKAGYYFKFKVNGLLRGTQKDRYEAYGKGIQDGWLTRNEARGFEDLNPLEGLDEALMPLNMVPVGDYEPDAEDPPPDEDQQRFIPHIERAVGDLLAFDAKCLENAKGDTDNLLDRYEKSADAFIDRALVPLFCAAGEDGEKIRGDFAVWLSEYRVQSDDQPLDGAVITMKLLNLLGGTNES